MVPAGARGTGSLTTHVQQSTHFALLSLLQQLAVDSPQSTVRCRERLFDPDRRLLTQIDSDSAVCSASSVALQAVSAGIKLKESGIRALGVSVLDTPIDTVRFYFDMTEDREIYAQRRWRRL